MLLENDLPDEVDWFPVEARDLEELSEAAGVAVHAELVVALDKRGLAVPGQVEDHAVEAARDVADHRGPGVLVGPKAVQEDQCRVALLLLLLLLLVLVLVLAVARAVVRLALLGVAPDSVAALSRHILHLHAGESAIGPLGNTELG